MQSIQQQFSSNLRFILWNNRYESDAIDLIIILLESRIYSLEQSMWIRCNRSNNNSPRISDLSFGTIDVNRSNNNFPRISDLSFGTIDVNPIQSIQQQFSLNLGFILWNNRCESIQQQFFSNLGFILWNNRCESIQQQFSSNLRFILWNNRCESIQQQFSILESLIYGKKKEREEFYVAKWISTRPRAICLEEGRLRGWTAVETFLPPFRIVLSRVCNYQAGLLLGAQQRCRVGNKKKGRR